MLRIRVHTADGTLLVDPPVAELVALHRDPGAKIWVDMEEGTSTEISLVGGGLRSDGSDH